MFLKTAAYLKFKFSWTSDYIWPPGFNTKGREVVTSGSPWS